MLFRSFESNQWKNICEQMEVVTHSFATTVVFIFCDPSQRVRGQQVHLELKESFP